MVYALQNLEYEDMLRLFSIGTLTLDAELANEENPPQELNFGRDTVDGTVTYRNGVISVSFLRLIDIKDDHDITELFNHNFYSVIEEIVAWINDGIVNHNVRIAKDEDHDSDN